MMNIKTNEKVSFSFFKVCPLLRETCKAHECTWFLSDEKICAITRIAVDLDVIVEILIGLVEEWESRKGKSDEV